MGMDVYCQYAILPRSFSTKKYFERIIMALDLKMTLEIPQRLAIEGELR